MRTLKILLITAFLFISGSILQGPASAGTPAVQDVQFCIVRILASAGGIPIPPDIGSIEDDMEQESSWLDISVTNLDFGIIGEEDYIAGYAIAQDHPIFLDSPKTWSITVKSLNPDLGTSDDGSYIKPVEDLQWRLSTSDEDTWTSISETPKEITWGDGNGSGVVYVDFRVVLEWADDVPGEYSTELLFTIDTL